MNAPRAYFSSPDGLRNSVGKTVAKNFPYRKQG